MSTLSENIWLTYQARLQASKRLAKNGFHSNNILITYAIINICIAVMAIKEIGLISEQKDLFLIVMAIILLVAVLLITSQKFKEKSLLLKSHANELYKVYYQALEAEDLDSKDRLTHLRKRYEKILNSKEVHKPIDEIMMQEPELNFSSKNMAKSIESTKVVSYKVSRLLTLGLLYLCPIIVLYLVSWLT